MSESTMQVALQQVAQAEQLVSLLEGTGNWQAQLRELHSHLEQRQRQVAVFGAFSTGKSSLINALLGDPVLVVSPNPTTASVTHVHGNTVGAAAAVVTAKTHEQLWTDVEQALWQLHLGANDLAGAVRLAEGLKPADTAPALRKYVSFLRSVAAGYGEMADKLGTTWAIDAAALRRYTAEEKYACYVNRVDLPSDAQFVGESGIVLVDTPGVDSIHRRHTDVAFQYMRSADAIIFVLYYTHAFSRADKEFLMQLAGVQDVTGSNKLFVVINAVDLAENEEERTAVRERVEQELRQLGIRRPRVFEVSSQLAFAAEQMQQHPDDERFTALIRQRLRLHPDEGLPNVADIRKLSGVRPLQEDILEFVEGQADALMRDAVARRLASIAEELARGYQLRRQKASADATALAALQADTETWVARLRQEQDSITLGQSEVERTLQTEWDELRFHISERVRLRFSGLFRESFHPGRFRVSSQSKTSLEDAAIELTDAVSRQIETECRTFALRTQRQLLNAAHRVVRNWQAGLNEGGIRYSFVPEVDDDAVPVPELPARVNIPWHVLRPVFRHYSSPRQFFEEGGQQAMLTAAEPTVMEQVTRLVETLTDGIKDAAIQSFRSLVAELAQVLARHLVDDAEDSVDGEELLRWEQAAAWFEQWQEARNVNVTV